MRHQLLNSTSIRLANGSNCSASWRPLLVSPIIFFTKTLLLGVLAAFALDLLFCQPARCTPLENTPPTAPPADSLPLPKVKDVVRKYQPPATKYGSGHRGVDIRFTANQLVPAMRPGRVSFVGQVAGVKLVSIAHPDGTTTTYQPVDPTVTLGQQLSQGQPIGHILSGHCESSTTDKPEAFSYCLHLGYKNGETYLDPTVLLGKVGKVKLLPFQDSSELAGVKVAPNQHDTANIRQFSRSRMSHFESSFKPFVRNVGVDLGGGNRGVTQDFLHRAKISAALQQMGGHCVPQSVRANLRGLRHC